MDLETLLIEISCHVRIRVLRHIVKHRSTRPRSPLPRLPLRPGEHEGALIPVHREHPDNPALDQLALLDGLLCEGSVPAPGIGLDVDLAHVHGAGDGALGQRRRGLGRGGKVLVSLRVLLDVRLRDGLEISEALAPGRADVHVRQLLVRGDIAVGDNFKAVVLEIPLHVRVRVFRHVVEHRSTGPGGPLPGLALGPGEDEGAVVAVQGQHTDDALLDDLTCGDGHAGKCAHATPGIRLAVDLVHVHAAGVGHDWCCNVG
mmetsp:Transcript_54214/g.144607  ORF Transcript_54214/g.144607 Transcript_54214/m.144607 type:complete len:259 (-) Transcript_54214:132-908(-)